jgi:hypothetical protein
MQVVVPNEVRQRLGMTLRPDGQETVQLGPQQRAEMLAQTRGTRQRDVERQNNATDSPNSPSGRNPGGEGRSTS